MKDSHPEDLTDRQIYNTAIGPVCMSKKEFQDYQELLERRQAAFQKSDEEKAIRNNGGRVAPSHDDRCNGGR